MLYKYTYIVGKYKILEAQWAQMNFIIPTLCVYCIYPTMSKKTQSNC
jgi:hypothetical protein